MKLEQYIRERAFALGFGAIGFASVAPSRSIAAFKEWLAAGFGAGIYYLSRQVDARSDPCKLSPPAKTIIVVAAAYPSDENDCPISNYARGIDYHVVLKAKLSRLSEMIDKKRAAACAGHVCVDSAPLLEREWAMRAGIGWIGKQGSVVNPVIGCCFFLGELLVNFELAPSPEIPCRCQECNLCVKACPTGAIMSGNQIDARRCIAFLTVEHKGEIAPEAAMRMGNSVYGCDRCTSVCPWNKRAQAPVMAEFDVKPSNVPALDELSRLNKETFNKMFRDSPVKRIGLERFLRNVKIALANNKRYFIPRESAG